MYVRYDEDKRSDNKPKVTIGTIVKTVPKGWGEEVWVVNNDKYCGKILNFKAGAKFSDHFHVKKTETFFVVEGELSIKTIDLENAEQRVQIIKTGDVVDIPPLCPHQITAITDSRIIEFSTTHFDNDSYRIAKGDSQWNANLKKS
jgi:mannose-6-phosphate isomerase-like protein (cupin superfamily)